MSDFWQVSIGSSSTRTSLADLDISSGRVRLGSLVEDQFTFTQVFEDAANTSLAIASLAEVTLWRNGARFFKGVVTKKRARDTSSNGLVLNYTVSGIWWWLEQTPLSGIASGHDAANTEERLAFAFEEGDLRSHVIAIIDRAKTLGVDIDVGGISSMFDVPQITLKQMSCADALVELLRFVPDSMCWINYGGSGNPTFNVKRRQYAGTNTLVIGQKPCTSIDVNPRLELETTQVNVSYVERDVTGAAVLHNLQAGEADDSVAFGKRQIVTVSGPELDTFLPNDLFDTYEMETKPLTDVRDLVYTTVPGFDDAVAAGLTNQINFTPTTWTYDPLPGSSVDNASISIAGSSYTIAGGGNAVDYHTLVGARPPQWLIDEHDAREVEVTGSWWYLHKRRDNITSGTPYINPPTWLTAIPSAAIKVDGYVSTGSNWEHYQLYSADYKISGWVVPTAYATATTVYKAADYSYVTPPAGFAAGLLSTQNFVPYEGSVGVAHEEAGAVDYRGRCVNISGSLPEHASMKALVQSVDMDLATGATSIELGVPQRLSYLGLVNRFRRTASDNIIWLDGSTLSGGGATSGSGSGGSGSLGGDGNSGGATTGSGSPGSGNNGGTSVGGSGSSGGSDSSEDGTGDTELTNGLDVERTEQDLNVSYLSYYISIYGSIDESIKLTLTGLTGATGGWSATVSINGANIASASGGGARQEPFVTTLPIDHSVRLAHIYDELKDGADYDVQMVVKIELTVNGSVAAIREFVVIDQHGRVGRANGAPDSVQLTGSLPIDAITLDGGT